MGEVWLELPPEILAGLDDLVVRGIYRDRDEALEESMVMTLAAIQMAPIDPTAKKMLDDAERMAGEILARYNISSQPES